MEFKERIFGGQQFRPRPEILFDQEGGLLLVTTPWGNRSAAEKVNSLVRDQFFSARADSEVTSPFDRLTCLTSVANDLRIALKLANDAIYNEDNRDEYVFGFEITAISIDAQEVTWVQTGMPALYLDRPNSCLLPIAGASDLSTEFGHPKDLLAPLPSAVLGADPTSDFSIKTIRPQPQERLILVSRAFLPQSFFEIPFGSRTLENISQAFSEDNETMPFWIGELNLG